MISERIWEVPGVEGQITFCFLRIRLLKVAAAFVGCSPLSLSGLAPSQVGGLDGTQAAATAPASNPPFLWFLLLSALFHLSSLPPSTSRQQVTDFHCLPVYLVAFVYGLCVFCLCICVMYTVHMSSNVYIVHPLEFRF